MPSSKPRTQDLQDIQTCQYRVLSLERRGRLHRQRLLFDLIESSVALHLPRSSRHCRSSKHSSCRYSQPERRMSPVLRQQKEMILTGHSNMSVQGLDSGEAGQA